MRKAIVLLLVCIFTFCLSATVFANDAIPLQVITTKDNITYFVRLDNVCRVELNENDIVPQSEFAFKFEIISMPANSNGNTALITEFLYSSDRDSMDIFKIIKISSTNNSKTQTKVLKDGIWRRAEKNSLVNKAFNYITVAVNNGTIKLLPTTM